VSESSNPLPDLAQLKVCLLAGTLGQGGAERQLFYIAQALKSAGCAVRVLSLTQGEMWEARLREIGVPVTWVGQEKSRVARLRAIVAELRSDKPHILQSAHFYANFYAAPAGRLAGVRDIGAIRSDAFSEARVHGRAAGILCMKLPRLLAVNSQVAMRNAQTLGVPARRLHFLPNVIDSAHFAPCTCSKSAELHLVAVGRLSEEKRFDRFLRVIAHLRGQKTSVRGTLVGDGPLRSTLENQARALKIADIVSFTGNVSDPRPYLQAAQVAMLTSVFEGTPNVLLEAQACGLPVVATNVGGVRDVVRDGETGLLISPGDEEETVAQLARAVETLQDAPRRVAMGVAARRYIEENYAAPRLPQFLSELYAKALN
jgi:glycosyltransferase involved in cell wall biosynthesis